MARFRRQRPLVHDFEVDQARPVVLGVIKNVSGGGIAVRPAVAEFIAPINFGAMNSLAAALSIRAVSVPRFMWSQRLSPGSLSSITVRSPEATARKPSPLSMLKHLISQWRHALTLLKKRIGMFQVRK